MHIYLLMYVSAIIIIVFWINYVHSPDGNFSAECPGID